MLYSSAFHAIWLCVHHSTETAINVFTEKVSHSLVNAIVGAVFLDLKRAFDTIDHQIPLYKLTDFNFSEQGIRWMNSY